LSVSYILTRKINAIYLLIYL